MNDNYPNFAELCAEDQSEVIDKYFAQERTSQTVWAGINQQLKMSTNSDLIEAMFGNHILRLWKDASNLLHNNPMYRLYFLSSKNEHIEINLNAFNRTSQLLFNVIMPTFLDLILVFHKLGHTYCKQPALNDKGFAVAV